MAVAPAIEGTKANLRGKSAKSSLFQARFLSSLDWGFHGECLHVSLTYHQEWPRTKAALARVKAHLVAVVGRHVECGMWCLEYQRRMAPHFHLLVWMAGRNGDEFAAWVAGWWADFSGNRAAYGCMVTRGDQARGVWYLSMHAAKRAQAPDIEVGRWWGLIHGKRLRLAQDIQRVGEVSARELVWWGRLYRRYTGHRTSHGRGFSWFLSRAGQTAAAAWIGAQVVGERLRQSLAA